MSRSWDTVKTEPAVISLVPSVEVIRNVRLQSVYSGQEIVMRNTLSETLAA
jgi:hypothetical protein